MIETYINIVWCLGTILCILAAMFKFSYNIQPKGCLCIITFGILHILFVFLNIEILAYIFNILMLTCLCLLTFYEKLK